MEGIVIDLEREALDENISVETLLRKAYLVARKLKLKDFEEWINNEQNGYKGIVPEYRMVRGSYKALNPYRGWMPVLLTPEMEQIMSCIPLRQSVSSLTETYTSYEKSVQFSLGAEFDEILNKITDGFPTQFAFSTSRSEIYRILSTVRNKILEWALLLEEQGIVGTGVTFTEDEKTKAQNNQIINNYTNNFYSKVSGVEINQS